MFSIGLMSGTSMDGIDAVLCQHKKNHDQTLAHIKLSYPKAIERELRARIFHYDEKLAQPLESLADLHWQVGDVFARATKKLLQHAYSKKILKKTEQKILIGSHGQTIYHAPDDGVTWQIGESAKILSATGITTVSDFRAADVAAGGQGAPLLPWYHRRIISQLSDRGIAIHNMGGISNFTYCHKSTLIAFDTGPANCMLDTAIQVLTNGKRQMDLNGREALRGFAHLSLLQWLKDRPAVKKYRRLAAPKSTGRELFSHDLTLQFLEKAERQHLSLADSLATLTVFSADLMAEAYERFILKQNLPLKEIYVAGGGAKNAALLQALELRLPEGTQVKSLTTLGIDPQVIEAQAFGYFAWCAVAGLPITMASTTGLKQPIICGKISPGKNWRTVLQNI
jgi:anhydro-N-acetylmuramic acid kinase